MAPPVRGAATPEPPVTPPATAMTAPTSAPPTVLATSPAPSTAAGDDHGFSFDVSLRDGFAQAVDFGLPGVEPLLVDEPEPLGESAGPNPARLLGAALATCLGASLLFCLRKARIDVHGLFTHVEGTTRRNERGRLRIAAVQVRLEPVVPAEQQPRMARCLEVFEDFCVVTASVRAGVDVRVEVAPTTPAAVGLAVEP